MTWQIQQFHTTVSPLLREHITLQLVVTPHFASNTTSVCLRVTTPVAGWRLHRGASEGLFWGCRQRRCKSSLQLLPSCHISPRNHSTLWIIHGGGGCSVLYLCILKENMNEGCKKWRAAEWLRSFCAMMFYREQFSSLLYLSLCSYSSANLHPGVGGICLLWFLFEVFQVLWRD